MNERCVRTSGLLVISAAWVLILSLFARHADPTLSAGDQTWPDTEAGAIRASAQFSPTAWVYLPVVTSPPSGPVRRVNAPYFSGPVRFSETAIFWFGRVNSSENYADVRVGYSDNELYIYVAAFDRLLWYDTTPTVSDLTAWDSATLYVDLGGNNDNAPTPNAYRFDAQANWHEARAPYQADYRGDGSDWAMDSISFTTTSGYKGSWNDSQDAKGWALGFTIPFTSLGLSGPPAPGTTWRLGVVVHDRDDNLGTPIGDKVWPENMDGNRPSSWGQLRFGLPTYTPPAASGAQSVTIRHKLNGVVVKDGMVGGSSTCGGDPAQYWTQWGETNYAGATTVNVQNQSDISDWPCFSKYYVTFPLDAVPSDKVIISATLTLHQIGNSGPASNGQPPPASLIQVMTVAEDWNEAALTWNNAPFAMENVSRAWVQPIEGCGAPGGIPWPCVPRTWDVSLAVAQANAARTPLRLVLYSADSDYSTGKYFTSSYTGDWNAEGRPTLQVLWGDP